MGRFTELELRILRNAIEPKRMEDLVFAVLGETFDVPDWIVPAREAGWEPTHKWFGNYRGEIRETARKLVDRGVLGYGKEWKIYRISQLTEMEILAEQVE